MLSKTFGREADQLDQFKENSSRLTVLSLRQAMTGQTFFVVMQTFFTMAPAVVWLIGGYLLTGGGNSLTLGDIVAFTAIQTRLLFPLAGLFNRGVELSSSIALFDRIFEYLDIDPKIKDPATVRGEIAYQTVGFRYEAPNPNGDAPFALRDISFAVPSSSLTALVGPSGAGKTSVGYLLARLYDADTG